LSSPLGAAVTLEQLDRDPHPTLARLREHEPVSWLPALGGWLVTRRDLALAAMRDPDTLTVDDPRFATARVVGPSMLSLDGDAHDRHRAPFAQPFRLAPVRERFTDLVAAETDRLIDSFEAAGEADLRRRFAGPLATAAVTHALGLDSAEVPTILGWYEAIVHATTEVTAGGEVTDDAREAVEGLRAAVETTVEGGDSLLAAAARGLDRAEVVSNAGVLLFGGIETTEGMIANALLHLLEHPDQLALVRADPALTANAIEESLRLEPAAATVDRYATRDTEIGGAHIVAGDLVTISITAANRDPGTFPDPDRFDVTRENARLHIAFAHGPHVCVGMHLARLEAHTAVARVLERLPELRLDPAQPPPRPRGLVFRKPDALPVVWK
jgi:cytochrome P450